MSRPLTMILSSTDRGILKRAKRNAKRKHKMDNPNMTIEEAVVHIDDLLADYEISMHMGPTANHAWRMIKAALKADE